MAEPEESAPPPDEEEDEATKNDREGGRQFGRALMALGAVGIGAGLYLGEQYLLGGGIALGLVGFVAHRWPVKIVRLLSGMGDKM